MKKIWEINIILGLIICIIMFPVFLWWEILRIYICLHKGGIRDTSYVKIWFRVLLSVFIRKNMQKE